jgi:predicted methyltransferase
VLAAAFTALKPGGVLGVVQHRAKAGDDLEAMAKSGYVTEAYVIAAVEKAGFTLAASSDINANPKDTADHPYGVWSLPPALRGGDEDRAKFEAMGESDRMTLRFVKPE